MKASRKLLVLAAMAVVGCSAAEAQMYLGAGLGQAHLKATGERSFDVKAKSDTRELHRIQLRQAFRHGVFLH